MATVLTFLKIFGSSLFYSLGGGNASGGGGGGGGGDGGGGGGVCVCVDVVTSSPPCDWQQ